MNESNHANTITRPTENEKRATLVALADELINEITTLAPDITEGLVMTTGPAPYRRLDCDRRALVYVRTRPRKRMVRLDVSGLWILPASSPLRADSSGGSASLILRSPADKDEAIAFLLEAVETTRDRLAKRREAEEQRRGRIAELRATMRHGRQKNPPHVDGGATLAPDPPPRETSMKLTQIKRY